MSVRDVEEKLYIHSATTEELLGWVVVRILII